MRRRLILAALGSLAAMGIWFAWHLGLDYFDSYDTLNNARRLVGASQSEYVVHRGLLAGPLFASVAWGERWFSGWPTFRLAHLLAFTLTAVLVIVFHRTARRWYPKSALAATLAFALSPLVVHYAAFAKEDMPSALFVLLGFAALLSERVSGAGLAFAAASLLKPALIPAIGLTLLVARREKRGAIRLYGTWALAVAAGAAAVYAWAKLGGVSQYARDLLQQWRDNQQGYHPPAVGLALLGASLPLAIGALAAVAALRKEKDACARLASLWAGVFLAVFVFVVPGKEARYFLPALPALYLLAASTAERLPRWAFAVWWLTFPAGLWELGRLADPIFQEPHAARLAHEADRLSTSGRVVWVGPFYPLRPPHHRLHEDDDYFSLFHLWRNGLAFHLKREVPAIVFPQIQERFGERLPVNLARLLRTGDAIFWNPEPMSYATRNLPDALAPLILARVRVGSSDKEAPAEGPYELYDLAGEKPRSLGWRDVRPLPPGMGWLQFEAASSQAPNRREYTPYTL